MSRALQLAHEFDLVLRQHLRTTFDAELLRQRTSNARVITAQQDQSADAHAAQAFERGGNLIAHDIRNCHETADR
jgi:hypothetical protein